MMTNYLYELNIFEEDIESYEETNQLFITMLDTQKDKVINYMICIIETAKMFIMQETVNTDLKDYQYKDIQHAINLLYNKRLSDLYKGECTDIPDIWKYRCVKALQ